MFLNIILNFIEFYRFFDFDNSLFLKFFLQFSLIK